ncbi:MAG TPA: xanthine dehydrogenase family protein subunit M [Gemmatimonadales bacterium]|nr:xanthine dehydrogenase family protein subunit M [Gemmatimonadales bacterium]
MKPAPFEYHRPDTVDEALALLAEYGGDARALAGGQSLVPAMNFRLARPRVLVDLNRLDSLSYVRAEAEGLHLGAMTRQRAVERSEVVRRDAPLVAEAIPFVAHPQIRSRGTVGGSVAHADPAAELPAVLLALGARFQARSRATHRWIAAGEFFTGLFATALAPDELLTDLVIPPRRPRTGWAFAEVSRRHGDYALAGAAAEVTLDQRGDVAGARIALLSVGDGPVLAREGGATLTGSAPSPEAIGAAAHAAATRDIDPPSDIHASAAYRRHLARVLVRRVLTAACQRARGSSRSDPA